MMMMVHSFHYQAEHIPEFLRSNFMAVLNVLLMVTDLFALHYITK